MKNVALLRLHDRRARRPRRLRRDTSTAAPRPTTRPTCCARRRRPSSATRSRPASRSSSTSPSRRRTCRRSRRRATTGCSRASRRGGRRATTRPTSPTSRPGCRTAAAPQNSADLDQIRIDQLEMLQAVDEAIGGSTTVRHHRHHGAPAQPRRRRQHASSSTSPTTAGYWGEHRLRAKNKPYEEAIRSPDVRPLPEARAAPAHRDALRAQHRPRARRSPSWPASASRSPHDGDEPACASSTAPQPTLAHRLPDRGLAGQPSVGDRCARRSGSTPRSRSPRAIRPRPSSASSTTW